MRYYRHDCIAYDSAWIKPSSPPPELISLFRQRSGLSSELVTAESEAALVRWLFSDQDFRSLVLRVADIPLTVDVFAEVETPVADRRFLPGDIDILLITENFEHQAVAIEAKVVKLTVDEANQDRANRITKLQKAIVQANGLRSRTFHRSFVLAITATDGRHRTTAEGSPFFSFADANTLGSIMRTIFTHGVEDERGLRPDVGILLVEVVQSMDGGFYDRGMICAHLGRPALAICQSDEVTNRVREMIFDTRYRTKYHVPVRSHR